MKKKIEVIGNFRGFLKELFTTEFSNFVFYFTEKKGFEILSKKKELLIRFFNNKKFDFLGLFTIRKVNKSNFDYFFSYNRFMKIDNGKYVIFLENPTALVNYSDTKMFSIIAKKKINKFVDNQSLLKIVCMSKSCYEGMKIYYPSIHTDKIMQIYPLINDNSLLTDSQIKIRSYRKKIKCLFVSSQFNLKGGEDLLKVFDSLKNESDIELIIVTDCSKLTEQQYEKISKMSNVILKNFDLDRKALFSLYSECNILLNPSRMDSFSLVTLEAIKNGCVVISSDIYAIKEMVFNDQNGFLKLPKYQFWNEDGSINHYIKSNPILTYASNYLDDEMINFIKEKVLLLYYDRKKLMDMGQKSLEISRNDDFSSYSIKQKWEQIY